MSRYTLLRKWLNVGLGPLNLKLETLTAAHAEHARLNRLVDTGDFENSVFPVPECFANGEWKALAAAATKYQERFTSFRLAGNNDVGYSFNNDYYTSPDTEVLYTLVRELAPARIVEVGSGNSTRIARQAIIDGTLPTKITSIDPSPRIVIEGFSDDIRRQPVETLSPGELAQMLDPGSFLFIDSSHLLVTGNDVAFLMLRVLPILPVGVIVHIHDIFIPYEYPKSWVLEERFGWNEQYLVYAMLAFGSAFDVIWAGHHLQRTVPGFTESFPEYRGVSARSMWLRKVR